LKLVDKHTDIKNKIFYRLNLAGHKGIFSS